MQVGISSFHFDFIEEILLQIDLVNSPTTIINIEFEILQKLNWLAIIHFGHILIMILRIYPSIIWRI